MSEHTCQCRLSQENAELRARVREVEAGVESMIARMEAAWDAGWKREPWRISAAQHFQNAIAAARPLPPPVLPRTMTEARAIAGVEPRTVADGSFDAEYELAPGVRGYAIEHAGRVFIPALFATRPGSGDVGRFIDSLSDRCVFPCVISSQLAGMLLRRGYEVHYEIDPNFGESVDVWSRPPNAASAVPNGPATPRETR